MELIRSNQLGKLIKSKHKSMWLNVTNRDTQSHDQSQQMSWHAIYSILYKGSLWYLMNNYSIDL